MDTCKAQQQHSHSYKDPYPFKDKVVVLVGIGNSAVDVATEVSRWAKAVYLVTRKYVAPAGIAS
jgi:dimethylaniline monooxygenase (N-oxide forming)